MCRSKGEKIFSVFNILFMLILGACMLFPFMHVLAKSLSSETAVMRGEVLIVPKELHFGTYQFVMTNSQFYVSFFVSLRVTIIGTLLAMGLTIFTAYPLSKRWLKGRSAVLMFYLFIMLFQGGIVPNYLLYRTLNLTNTIFCLILPMCLNVFNMLIMKNYFETMPESIEESARIDGAEFIAILFRIVIPISMPVIATIALFYSVDYWNNFFYALLYNSSPKYKPLQLFLYEMVTEVRISVEKIADFNTDRAMNLTAESILSATIIVATMPILLVYPFLQRYFVKGIIIGSVKG